MASPFTIFRKNQKALLVAVTLMAMFSFVFLDIFNRYGGGGASARADDAPVVTTSEGTLTEGDLEQIRQDRLVANHFYARAGAMGNFGAVDPEQAGGADALRKQLVGSWMFMQEARKLGIVVTDAQIEATIDADTGNALSSDKFKEILSDMRIGAGRLYDALRNQLLAREAASILMPYKSPTPEEMWQYYRRVHETRKVELAAIPVDQFLDTVGEPLESDLLALFNEGVERRSYVDDGSVEPGFFQPRRVQFQYLVVKSGEVEKQAVKDKPITDAEIEKYYADHKEEYKITKALPDDLKPKLPEGEAKPDAEKTPDAGPSLKAPEGEKKPSETKPDEKKPEDKPAEEKPAEEKPADKPVEPKAEDKPADTPTEDPKPESKSEEEKKDCGQDQPAEEKPTAEPKPEAKPADEKPAEPKTEEKPAGTEEKPAEIKPAEAKLAAEKTTEEKTTEEKTTAEKTTEEKTEEVKYRPLDKELRETIREKIAKARGSEAMKTITDELQKQLYKPGKELVTKYRPTQAPTPEKTKEFLTASRQALKALARPPVVVFGETGMMTLEEFKKMPGLDNGMEDLFMQLMQNNPMQRIPPGLFKLTDTFTQESICSTSRITDQDENEYFFWRVQINPAHSPKLDEPGIREEVVKAWKRSKAVAEAKARAEKLAKQANDSKKPLPEVLADQTVTGKKGAPQITVISPGEFSWWRRLVTNPTSIELSDGAVEQPTETFMRTVFDELKVGQTGVAVNPRTDGTIVYVVKVLSATPANRDNFFAARAFEQQPYTRLAALEARRVQNEFFDRLEKTYALEWKPLKPVE